MKYHIYELLRVKHLMNERTSQFLIMNSNLSSFCFVTTGNCLSCFHDCNVLSFNEKIFSVHLAPFGKLNEAIDIAQSWLFLFLCHMITFKPFL